MSDAPQGPGWWQASDGKWYPPQEPPTEPTPATQPVPPVPPPGPPTPPTATFGPVPPGPPPPGGGGGNRTPLFIGIGVLVVALGVIAFLLTRDDDDEGADKSDQTEQTENTEGTESTDESDNTESTEESDVARLDDLLLTVDDVGEDFHEIDLPPNREDTLCGTPSFRETTDPEDHAGIAVQSAGASISALEELYRYKTESEAKEAYDTALDSVSCESGKLEDGTEVAIEGFDARSTVKADEAWGINITATDIDVDGMVARVGNILIVLQGVNDSTSSGLPLVDFEDLAKLAVEKVKEG